MRRFKNLVIGGIQAKIFNLILLTVGLVSVAYMIMSLLHANMLSKLVTESGTKQQQSIAETTTKVMDQVVSITLRRANRTEARIADDMFAVVGGQVEYLRRYVTDMITHPEDYTPQPYSGPNPEDDGTWTAKVIFADDADPADPALVEKIGLLANVSDMMITMCKVYNSASIYIAMPEGAHLSVNDQSSSWFSDGELIDYDPRTRGWYQEAIRRRKLVFSDGEQDALTGSYCIECSAPVYDEDGNLFAVIGADLFLDEMEEVFEGSSIDGEVSLLINRNGYAVLAPQEEAFPMADADRGRDLRKSELTVLAQVTNDALRGNTTSVMSGDLQDGAYYITASPLDTTGWVLISAYSHETAGLPAAILQDNLDRIQTESRGTYAEKTKDTRTMTFLLLTGVFLVTIAAALILGKRIVRPLNAITTRISELSGDDLEFKMEDVYRTGDEVEQLAESFATLSHRATVYMNEIVQVTAEKERISTELSLATDIQAAMLPHIFPAFPNRAEFDIYASMNPAKEVGGDFYDYFLIDEDHLGLVIADVSGKGVPAALFMMASKIILQSVAMLGNSPAEILTKTNEALCSNNEAEMFVTVWMGILEISTGRLTAANAGHEYPALKLPNGEFDLYKDKHGFVIGNMPGYQYKEYELMLEPGAKVFLYTDGVPEATNAQKELFGTKRMIDTLNEQPETTPQEILQNVRTAVNGFVEDAEQFDDLTMLCIEYKGFQK